MLFFLKIITIFSFLAISSANLVLIETAKGILKEQFLLNYNLIFLETNCILKIKNK
jgi:hypothetical protein